MFVLHTSLSLTATRSARAIHHYTTFIWILYSLKIECSVHKNLSEAPWNAIGKKSTFFTWKMCFYFVVLMWAGLQIILMFMSSYSLNNHSQNKYITNSETIILWLLNSTKEYTRIKMYLLLLRSKDEMLVWNHTLVVPRLVCQTVHPKFQPANRLVCLPLG